MNIICNFISIRRTGQGLFVTHGQNSNVSLVKTLYVAIQQNISVVRDRQNMGESLFGKLRDVLSREKTSDITSPVNVMNSPATLARIGLATGNPAGTVLPGQNSAVPGMPVAEIQQVPSSSAIAPVGIQFFAEVPSQQCANEIVSISQGAHNCLSAEAQPVGDSLWTVAITLCMTPVPQEIHAIETVFQTWAQKLGGASKGWGLSQNQTA